MLVKKLQLSAICGGVLSVIVIAMTISEGKSISEALSLIPGAMFIGAVAVFWFTRDMDEYGNEGAPSANQQIASLQKRLQTATWFLTDAEARGSTVLIAKHRAEVLQIESELRRLGA